MKEEPRTPIARIDDHPNKELGTTEAMINVQPVTYTSLKDVLQPSTASPMAAQESSISRINGASIRNPLVKQAALAYLQPVISPVGVGDKGRPGKFSDPCGGGRDGAACQCGCMGWFNGVVLAVCRALLGKRRAEDEDEDDDDDEAECEKVD